MNQSCTCATLLLLLAVLGTAAADADLLEDSSLSTWSVPSMPKAVAERRGEPPGDGPVFLKQPADSRRYAHRQGELALQLPAGALDLQLKLVKHENFVFGTAFSPETVPAEDLPWYLNTTLAMFDALTPENRFKWPLYERSQGQYKQAQQVLEQQYIAFAQAADYSLVRGHTLEWGKVGPFWAHKLECDAYVAALKARVTRDVKLFKGKFNQYDVFNEIIESPGMLSKCDLWNTAFPDAFKWAAAADPSASLCINDLSLIEAHNAPELIRIIQQHVWAHGAPLHCIGIQAHFTNAGVNLTHQQEKLDLLATLGLDLYITEFSLFSTWSGPNGKPISYLDEATQATTTAELFRLWFSHPAVKGIIMWGWWDSNIWITNAGIYNTDKTPKQAAKAIQQLWDTEFSTSLHIPQPQGLAEEQQLQQGLAGQQQSWTARFTGFYGTYAYEFTAAGGRVVQGRVQLGRQTPQQSLVEAV